ncbi:DinB family protein [Luteolibacter arcticus]|uniref:DinB family protein n=1 Tax=Luteolibacter arcticus TaxID=1581411 RepID=A0ABT3GN86_9BACT|nr:DinB family protein [Luteolibacter arcticus]MCW1924975.1 DinB family protein [Luteolibacter arcticus]
MNESSAAPSSLAPPGAGLPRLEEFFLRSGLKIYSRLAGRERVLGLFLRDAERVLSLATPLDEATGRKAVLVPRVRGMEDSSRCWSPYMIVQHLVIVDKAILGMILLLAGGKTTNREVRVADVKPSPEAGPEVMEEFRAVLARWQETLAGIKDLRGGSRHAHPWFGPLDAHEWMSLAALHHGIHLRQMERVVNSLR